MEAGVKLSAKGKIKMEIPAKLQRLPGPMLRLITERLPYWEYLFFSEALEEELRSLSDLKRDWKYNVASGGGALLKPSQLVKRVQEKNNEASRMKANVESLVKQALPAAFGQPGVSGDPEAIFYVAKRLGGVYRNLLEWKLDYQRFQVPEEMQRLRLIAATMCDDMVLEIEEFSHELKTSLTNAVEAVGKGQSVKVHLTLTLTIPAPPEIEQEIARINGLVKAGAIRWE